jgi:tetratricopeptide (TPR) repeat protein
MLGFAEIAGWGYALSVNRLVFVAVFLCAVLAPGGIAQTAAPEPSSPDAGLSQAQADLDHGKNAAAIAILEKLAAANPAQAGVEHALGLAYYRTSRLEEAKQAFRQAIAQDPKDIESIQLEGLTLFRMGQPAAAVPYLEKAEQWMPSANADASHVLGLCYLNSRQFDKARTAFAAEYGLAPDSGAAHLVLAQMLTLSNLPDQGALEAERALALAPGLPLAHFLIGEVDLFESRVDAAIQEFHAEEAINPTYAPIYARLGDAYFRLGSYNAAEQALLKSLALDTSSTGPFIVMGKVLLRKNDPQTAALYLRHAEKMDPSNFMTHTLLGQAYRGLGDQAAARAEFDTAAKIQNANQLKLQAPQ